MDILTGAYFVAFAAGSGYALLSWLLAAGEGHGDASGTHVDASGHAAPGHGLGASLVAPFLNLTSLSALAAVGGGAGYLARLAGVGAIGSVLAAAPAGLAAAYGVSALLHWLGRGTRYMPPTELRGTLGTVLARVGPEMVGEISYRQHGARTSLPARSLTGDLLEPGTEVVLVEVRDGIAQVAPPDYLLEQER